MRCVWSRVARDTAKYPPPQPDLFVPDDDHVRVLGGHLFQNRLLDQNPRPYGVPRVR